MSRNSNIRIVDPVLTNLALGYSNAQFVGEKLMPFVFVEKENNKLPIFGKEAFKLYNTERGIRAKSNRMNPEGITLIDLGTTEHDLEYPMDYREQAEAAFNLQKRGTHVVTEAIQLRREKQIADLAQNVASYPTGNKIVLSGTSQFTNAASDPISVINTGKEAIRQKIGKRPNTMIVGAQALNSLKFHDKLTDKIKYTQTGMVDVPELRALFRIENIYVGEAVWAADDGTLSDVWGDNIILAYVPPQTDGIDRDLYEPSFGYTPRRKGNPQVDVYSESGGKLEIVRATDNFRPYIVGAEAGYLISDTNA